MSMFMPPQPLHTCHGILHAAMSMCTCVMQRWSQCPSRLTGQVVLSVEFIAVVREFEDWTELLLLDALQRSGFFTAGRTALSLAELQGRVPAGYMRFMAEATNLLRASGESLSTQTLTFMKRVKFRYP